MGSFSCEVTGTSIFPQERAPRPHYGLLSTGYQPSIGHPAQRLSRQRFSALARSGSVRRCKICGSFMGVKRTRVVASGLRLGGHFSLEVVDSTRPKPRHARHLRGAETRGEFARSSGTTNLSVAISSTVTT